ncbi:3-oxoacyl-ACP synthase [Salisediminibacterium beveridgei]|uniref:3-oxoacyl-[acyl-carrier-protein] synthase, KASIII n=1 Tax=Salisediminibacterium beveridgei TaxID=632773 RepID=A0A1D7QZ44_9BACI|nr:3-oxoacyl-ACP synthase [Salisediminibacterium beveridgei]AOM84283.1 3-oxoacyl-[acyl-carrier-protein] synthase, KASIII [Salisediminibacterium beveridgei]
MSEKAIVGIVGTGIYIPEERMTASDIAEKTEGNWTEEAIRTKLGISEKPVPGRGDGTQEMGVKAGLDALKRTKVDPKTIDLVIGIGEEWKEYPLTTSSIYIQEKIGATNAWAIDVQQRCGTCVSAMKIAKDMMIADDEIQTVMIVGGYRNGDLVDYRDPNMSMMYNLSAGGGAIILQKDYQRNVLLESSFMTDGSMARDAGVEFGGTEKPINRENLDEAYHSLRLFDAEHMKNRLNDVSMDNWMTCIDRAFEKSGVTKEELGYLAVLHFKASMHRYMLSLLGMTEEQTTYLSQYGHMGQIDQILSLHLGVQDGKVKDGTVVSMIAAGIGYAWAANVIRWGDDRS